MDKHSVKVLKVIGEFAVVFLVILALAIGIMRSFFPYIDRYRADLASKIAQLVHQPVTIGKLQSSWGGWSPAVRLDNLRVYDSGQKQVLLEIKEVQISINVLTSLWQRKFIPNKVHVSGTQLNVRQLSANSYDINGIHWESPAATPQSNPLQNALRWLNQQGELAADHLSLNYYLPNGKEIPLTQLQVQLQHGFFERRLIASGVLALAKPSPFRSVIKLKEELNGQLYAKGYFAAKNLDLAVLSQWLHWKNYSIQQGFLPSVKVWLDWQEYKLTRIQSLLELQQFQLNNSSNQASLSAALKANLLWENHKDGWALAADHIKLELGKQLYPLQHFSLLHKNPPSISNLIAADALDLQQIATQLLGFKVLNDQQAQLLTKLQPRGQVKNLLLSQSVNAQQKSHYTLSTELRKITLQPSESIPGVSNLQGKLYLSSELGGRAELAGKNLQLSLPKLITHPLLMDKYQFVLHWFKSEEGWRMNVADAQFSSPGLSFNGDMDLYLYNEDLGGPYIRLLGGVASADLRRLRDFVPDRYLQPGLAHWLQEAFRAGTLQGQLLLQGPLKHFPFDDNTGRFQVLAQTQDTNLNYKTDWPILQDANIQLQFDDRRLLIEALNGRILGQNIPHISAEIPNLASADLHVETQITSNASFAQKYVFQSPLQKILGEVFASFSINAPMQLQLGLEIPLHAGDESLQVAGQAKILPGTLSLLSSAITLDQFQGDISFTQDTVNAANLKGFWLKKPLTMSIATTGSTKEPVISLEGKSQIAVSDLIRLSDSALISKLLNGQTSFTVGLVVRKQDGQSKTVYTLDSNLEGLALKLPEPWKKSQQEKVPSHIEMQFVDGGKKMHIRVDYGKQFNAAIVMEKNQQKWTMRGANILLGEGQASFENVSGISVTGNLAYLNWGQLSDYLDDLNKQSGSSGKSSLSLSDINIAFGRLDAFGLKLDNARIQARDNGDAWNIQIDSPGIAGQVLVPKMLARGITGNFQRFIISADGNSQNSKSINPGKLPPLNLQFQNLVYGQRSFGAVSLISNPSGNSLQIQKLSARLPGFTLTASGQWVGIGEGQTTVLAGNFTSSDMGSTLKRWKVTGSLVGAAGKGSFNLRWPGPAYSPNMPYLDGSFSLELSKGQILNIGSSSQAEMGIGRILNLLSLQSLPRRLSLDFSDWTTQGFPFDRIGGDFAIKQGNAFTNNTQLNSSLAEVDTRGRIGLAAADYNLIMIIAPKLTGSLPVAATIVGGPVVGAAAWVANKMVGPVVGQIVRLTYRVTGPWTNPVIEKAK